MHRELTHNERSAVLKQTTGRDRLLLTVLLETGCRISEALGIRIEDIVLNVPNPYLLIHTLKRRKPMDRVVPLRAGLRDTLTVEVQAAGTGRTYLFESCKRPGQPINRRQAHNIVTRAFQCAGVEQASSHSCRATFISRLHRESVPIMTIAALAGHANIGSTQKYINITNEDLINAVNKLK